jgi:hydrogenase-4 component B
LSRRSLWGGRIATSALALAAAGAFAGVGLALRSPSGVDLDLPWGVPGGALAIRIDAIAAVFLAQIFLLSLLGSIYGLEYWPQSRHARNGRKLRLFYGLCTAGMAIVVIARNAVLFLGGWEVMAFAAFLLITTEDELAPVREVGYVYIVATRIGTLCLFLMFAILAYAGGYFGFGGALDARSPAASAVFLLGLAGFGIKAGIMPVHVWLPGAHASAPSHVSAVMSGVLIKTGIYGLLRLTSLFGHPPLWWGAIVLGLGVLSGVLGVAFAIGQHDLKRLLAYHSVENIGIICIGLGVALFGRALDRPGLVALGLAGCLLHVWNHGLFKALLFLSAGAVVHATGTRHMDALGGLLKKMPVSGAAFALGAAAICGLPPLNGFVSELFIYLGLLRASVVAEAQGAVLAGVTGVAALALIGALALACFTKALGAVFLGQARTAAGAQAHEVGASMKAPMFVLGALCLVIGLAPPLMAPVLDRATAAWVAGWNVSLPPVAQVAPLRTIASSSCALLAAVVLAGAWLVRRTGAAPGGVGTWDCGYVAPSARMQYTASSFAQMLVALFAWALRPSLRRPDVRGTFPTPQRFESHVDDAVLDGALIPFVSLVGRGFRWLRWVQLGRIHVYLLYILVTVVLMLVRSFS